MSEKLKIIAILQAVLAFIIVFALNYFALGMSGLLSFTGALGFTLLLGGWAAYRYNRYLKKQQAKKEKVKEADPMMSEKTVEEANKEKPARNRNQ